MATWCAMKLLVVDDDPHILEAVGTSLQLYWPHGEIILAGDGHAGLTAFHEHAPDLIILDLMMPGQSGFDLLRVIRALSPVPILLLTARDDDLSEVRGLELGADDYLAKPFSPLVLLARVKAVLRRAEQGSPARQQPDFSAAGLAIDYQTHEVTLRGAPVKLTPVEYKLLAHLTRNAGRLLAHQVLLDAVWGADYVATPDYLKVFISRLRAKLETKDGPRFIETERGVGYRFIRTNGAGGTTVGGPSC